MLFTRISIGPKLSVSDCAKAGRSAVRPKSISAACTCTDAAAESLRRGLRKLDLVARRDGDIRALGGERAGDAEADAAISPEHERAPALQAQIHAPSLPTYSYAIKPSPRLAQNVMRCSITAKTAYMTMPITAMTSKPANTSAVSKFAVAAIIR